MLQGQRITGLIIRDSRLRWPVATDLPARLQGRQVEALKRRAKYILIRLDQGGLVWHLGMSGSIRVVTADSAVQKHDHIDLLLDSGNRLRYNDPRRFGCFLWCANPSRHPLLADLGPEPLGPDFTGELLYRRSRGRRQPVKSFIMDQKTVVGVGNIYASEALFEAGILPHRQAGRISRQRYALLSEKIRRVLASAIEQGGTTLRDFLQADGRPGYFRQQLAVYQREGLACRVCGQTVRSRVIGQRASSYCSHCQH